MRQPKTTKRTSDIDWVTGVITSAEEDGESSVVKDLAEALTIAEHHVANVARDRSRWISLRAQVLVAHANLAEEEARLIDALDYVQLALRDINPSKDEDVYLEILIAQGRLLLKHGIYEEALEAFSKASPLTVNAKNNQARGVVEGNIATVNFNLRHYEEAMAWFERAAESFSAVGNSRNRAFSIRGIGMTFSKQGMYEDALKQYNRALAVIEHDDGAIKEKVSLEESMGVDFLNIGDSTKKQRPYKEALKRFELCLDLSEQHELVISKAVALRNLGRTYSEPLFNSKDEHKARSFYERALEIVVERGVQQLELEVRRELSYTLEALGEAEAALAMFRKFYDMERSLLNEHAEEQTRAIELRYAIEKHEVALKQEHELAERVKYELESERQHLQSSLLAVTQKNAALRDTRAELTELMTELGGGQASRLKRIVKLLEIAEGREESFGSLEERLAHTSASMMSTLASNHPSLSGTERKVCALIHQDLSTKEIAELLSVEPATIGKYRQRIRKKLELDEGLSLSSYLQGITSERV